MNTEDTVKEISYSEIDRAAIRDAAARVRAAHRRERRKDIVIVCLSVLLLAAIAAGCIIAVAAIRALT